MSPLHLQDLVLPTLEASPRVVDLFAAARSHTAVAALASVHPELLALAPDDVFGPGGCLSRVARRALDLVHEARRDIGPDEARTARLEALALALLRTHHEIAWPDTLEILSRYDMLVARAERRFHELDQLVAHLVRRGKIARGSLPRCGRTTLVDRCERAILCVALLRDHGIFHVRVDLRATKAIARRLLNGRPRMPGELTPIETRDRAYTALCHALSEHAAQRAEPRLDQSGVFPIGEHDDDTTVRAA